MLGGHWSAMAVRSRSGCPLCRHSRRVLQCRL